MDSLFIVAMGFGTVILGLVGLVLLCRILSFFVRRCDKKAAAAEQSLSPAMTPEQKNKIICAIGAAIAEDCGTAPCGIRIVSIRKINNN